MNCPRQTFTSIENTRCGKLRFPHLTKRRGPRAAWPSLVGSNQVRSDVRVKQPFGSLDAKVAEIPMCWRVCVRWGIEHSSQDGTISNGSCAVMLMPDYLASAFALHVLTIQRVTASLFFQTSEGNTAHLCTLKCYTTPPSMRWPSALPRSHANRAGAVPILKKSKKLQKSKRS